MGNGQWAMASKRSYHTDLNQNSDSDKKQKLNDKTIQFKESVKMKALDDKKTRSNNVVAVVRFPPTASSKITSMELEAIFHPKFENESTNDKSIRESMLSCVHESKGYIEVSLKHSGSLLIWSGHDRFYSKNSLKNKFTYVGEILLRQHFLRAWSCPQEKHQEIEKEKEKIKESDLLLLGEKKFFECSEEMKELNLTCSFECVTSVLGDHGEKPKRDFMILTAIADRQNERFLSTAELVEFAQKWRLPHNDTWVFHTLDSSQKLFHLYDTTRETGHAQDTIEKLNNMCNISVSSMYPHVIFQGNILEGIVIRLVYSRKSSENEEQKLLWAKLGNESKNILNIVPPERPSFLQYTSASTKQNDLYSTNIRSLFDNPSDHHNIEDTLKTLIDNFLSEKKSLATESTLLSSVATFEKDNNNNNNKEEKLNPKEVQKLFMSMVHKLITKHHKSTAKGQTMRIASLLHNLEAFNLEYRLKMYKIISSSTTTQYLCTVHILHDSCFQKYNRNKKKEEMHLYRGFCIRITLADDGKDKVSMIEDIDDDDMMVDSKMQEEEEKPLMLKMKFLPYMIRTFGCRNGLKILSSEGPEAFEQYTLNLLQKWNMSDVAINTWQPFFQAWGKYAFPRLLSTMNNSSNNNTLQPKKKEEDDNDNDEETPLSNASYLDHFEKFRDLYSKGAFVDHTTGRDVMNDNKETFRGLVVVVGLQEETTTIYANQIANMIGCKRIHVNNLTPVMMAGSLLQSSNGGLVCVATVEGKGGGNIRKLLNKYSDSIYILIHNCGEEEVSAYADYLLQKEKENPNKEQDESKDNKKKKKKLKRKKNSNKNGSESETEGKDPKAVKVRKLRGMIRFWLETRTKNKKIQINEKSSTTTTQGQDNNSLTSIITKLREYSDALPEPDNRSGLLVFFPSIPGSGKSSLSDSVSHDKLFNPTEEENATTENNKNKKDKKRELIVKVGDKTSGKYWPIVQEERMEKTSSIYITDKNSPQTVWGLIGTICCKSRGLGIPVLPDEYAVKTTRVPIVKTTTSPTGEIIEKTDTLVYPFSLHYLALCVLRVLERKSGSHAGKLDKNTKDACMIVIKFFSFYKNYTSETLFHSISNAILLNGGRCAKTAIRVPFFKKPQQQQQASSELPDLPGSLKEALQEALKLQNEWDNVNSRMGFSKKEKDLALKPISNAMKDAEDRLRSVVKAEAKFLHDLECEEHKSSLEFVNQLKGHIELIQNEELLQQHKTISSMISAGGNTVVLVKLASIDVSLDQIYSLISNQLPNHPKLQEFIEKIGSLPKLEDYDDETFTNEKKIDTDSGSFITKTHVTMAHQSVCSQEELISEYKSLQGFNVQLEVTGILFSEKVAALSVQLPSTCNNSRKNESGESSSSVFLPKCRNDFPHITIWHRNDTSSVEGNQLPIDVKDGQATNILFGCGHLVSGTISFWDQSNSKVVI